MENQVTSYLEDSLSVVSSIVANKGLQSKIEQLALLIVSSLKKGGKIMFIGNGGSAADSQHMAAEYVSRFAFDRKGLPGIALTTDTSILTAIGNDYSFDNVFFQAAECVRKRRGHSYRLLDIRKIFKHCKSHK